MTAKVDSKEVGLVAGLNLVHFSLSSRDLKVYRLLQLRMPEQ